MGNKKQVAYSSGLALLELVIITPIIITIAFTGLEFSRSLKSYQLMSTASGASANSAFRDCADLSAGPAQTCLQSVKTNADTTYVQTVLPGAELVLSIYRYNVGAPPSATLVAMIGADPISHQTNSGNVSRYAAASILTQVPSLSVENPIIVVSEIFYRQQTIANFSKIFSYNPGIFYESTVY